MPTKKLVLAALLAALCTASHARPTAAPRLYLATEASPPSSMLEGGKVTGIATDKVRALMARAGAGYVIELLPWKRAYTAALRRPDACVFSTTRLPAREHLFKWIGPLDEAQWVLMGRADRDYGLHGLDDARRYRVGTYNGDARDQYLRERGFVVDPAQNDLINPRKLLLNRIDLWAASLRNGSTVLAEHGWAGRIVPVLVFNRVQVYLACNPAVPDALVARLNAAAGEMARDGSLRRIERDYEHWHARPGAAAE
jgi:polar amino acid transport system substrate-binding protein